MSYQCPLCHQSLSQENHTWRCENNHQFDRAKEGYVNLMPAHHKGSKNPGDNKEMMQARRLFLEADHYLPLRDKVQQTLGQHLPAQSQHLLDIGCGEGYYTSAFTSLTEQHPELQVHGLDISKVAVRYAAKRYKECNFCVASSHRLPFADGLLDGVVRIYAPCKAEELQRAIKQDGIIVTVTPAERHLYQLKAMIYDDVRLHDMTPETITSFELVNEERLSYTMTLNGPEATALMQMTPFAWKTSEAVWQQLADSEAYQCEADFVIRVYKKQA